MTTVVIDPAALAHLIAVVERCRRDWHAPGIRTALEAALGRHPYPDVALVALASARDTTARTPAVIPARCDQGWTGNDRTEPATPNTDRLDGACPHCGLWRVRGEDHVCARRADPDHARAMRDAAVAAARQAARPKETET